MPLFGSRIARVEDPKFLTVGGTYLADLRDPALSGAAYVTFARSTAAHARLQSVALADARAAPGVIAVFAAADISLGPLPPETPALPAGMSRPLLATGYVRFVGEPLAAIVTERLDQGEDAVELVTADYDVLTPVVEVGAAETNEPLLFPDTGTNVAIEYGAGHRDDLFDGCDVVVEQQLVNQRLAACPLEVRAAAAAWPDDDRLTFWVSTQSVHGVRDVLCGLYDLEPRDLRVVAVDVGGGFGAKCVAYPEELILPWIARHLGRPVRWVETRTENMVAMGHGRGQVQTVEIGGSRDGTIGAYRLTVRQDCGAYPSLGALGPSLTRRMAPGVYDIAQVECNATSLVTNTTPTVPYRGAGRPEATAAIERAVDLFAAEIGMDPVAVRRRNLVAPEAFPFTNKVGTTYDTGRYEHALVLALEAAGYDELRREQAARRAAGTPRQIGVGVSVYVEVTGQIPASEHAAVTVGRDGSAVVHTGTSPHGQGHATAWAMIAADELGIPMDRITVVHGDTDRVPEGTGTFGSRSLQQGGAAVHKAAVELVARARHIAADLLEANPDDVVLDRAHSSFHVVGAPAIRRSWTDVAATGPAALRVDTVFEPTSSTYPFGAHVAVVEVDVETGGVTVGRLIACDDAGRVLNPLIVEGQRHGGIAQGVAQALCEEVVYDADGNPITTTFADYAVVTAVELPSFELVWMETPTPANELGAKGIGESGTIGAAPAVQNAVVDAVAHLGVRHIDMPCTPERVWRAIRDAQAR